MKQRAQMLDFERAAELRDIAEALAKTIGKTRKFAKLYPFVKSPKYGT